MGANLLESVQGKLTIDFPSFKSVYTVRVCKNYIFN